MSHLLQEKKKIKGGGHQKKNPKTNHLQLKVEDASNLESQSELLLIFAEMGTTAESCLRIVETNMWDFESSTATRGC